MIAKSVCRVANVRRRYPCDRIQMYKNVDKNRFECARVWGVQLQWMKRNRTANPIINNFAKKYDPRNGTSIV